MNKILVLEDDELFAQTLEDFLEEEDYYVDIASDGQKALDLNYENNYDLYLLDINVPKINGLELLSQLRESGDETPAIYLTSYKDKQTLENGFSCGCDDYIKKPVDLNELNLRIKSILKRCGKILKEINISDSIIFNPSTKRVYNNGEDLNIPIKIVFLLELFLEQKDSIVTKDMIISKLWTTSEEYSEGSIRVYINNLKKIIGKDKIKNIKGIGYKLEL
ncbi:DNA-binding response regulator [Malaciobacter molluscorum LMG 25693]|uniref:DNA-binding response regulator n=1 Tax=Malaciobacter molluscorum LMG 25693 TaxID=870501 RepID=A0A2G1DKA5_9BACT|nr:response regulator transcription factor [Malaciobacter molluscorum]AXX92529.1 two-component system response regulator [Malaciobacter molluscorum LMG 25693]PHO18955.1 DNA-binding response regulator [Malaciobacter molluscorum LMG 25693]RXJ97259.1 DNA-binding response regulator [Malaciobacter molluscorum]